MLRLALLCTLLATLGSSTSRQTAVLISTSSSERARPAVSNAMAPASAAFCHGRTSVGQNRRSVTPVRPSIQPGESATRA